ncbi:MAG: hypothetical protein ACOCNC_02565 [Acetivibrio ethanolgignens]
MIRFCDQEVFCLQEDELDRGRLMAYFLDNHLDDVVCVIHPSGEYIGKIGYSSLLFAGNIEEAIQKEYVIKGPDMWRECREYFAGYEKKREEESVLLPVLDQNRNLIYFAYEDKEANRELRILKELEECENALLFSDIFPEYDMVRIYEFNELAFCFANYLKKQGVGVSVYGDMWKEFDAYEFTDTLDYRCLTIYAEGVEQKENTRNKNLVRSVSAEFECIDTVYEKNIQMGMIRATDERNVGDLLAVLKEKREIIIIGIDNEAQEAYDWLQGNGIEIVCFTKRLAETKKALFNKEVLSEAEARRRYREAVFIECHERYSAWNPLSDDFGYLGYERNKRLFFLKDYIEIPKDNLLHIIQGESLTLIGNLYLCKALYEHLTEQGIKSIVYCDILQEWTEKEKTFPCVKREELDISSIYLVVDTSWFVQRNRLTTLSYPKYMDELESMGIAGATPYFSYIENFIHYIEKEEVKYASSELRPKGILLGSIPGCSGNVFMRGVLDNHPDMLQITEYGLLNENLYWCCILLSQVPSEQMWDLFVEMFQAEGGVSLLCPEKFQNTMERLLAEKESFTSQELFVMFHIAYASMWKEDIGNIGEKVIYWEPHMISRAVVENSFARWLQADGVSLHVMDVSRNVITASGSRVRNDLRAQFLNIKTSGIFHILKYHPFDEKNLLWAERIPMRFEDIKCHPKRELGRLCDILGISWSDTLLDTTKYGKSDAFYNGNELVTGFNLRPVYDQSEEYFSAFDRFKIALINAPWQRTHGYPYEDILKFTRRQLQSIFEQPFRFEESIEFLSENEKEKYQLKIKNILRFRLQEIRRIALEEWYWGK